MLGIIEYINDPTCCTHRYEGIVTLTDSSALMLRYILVYGQTNMVSSKSASRNLDIEELDIVNRYAKLLDDVR